MSINQQNVSLKKNEKKEKIKNELNEEEMIIKWISELKNENTRTKAIENLSKYSEKNYNLAI